MAKKKQTRHKSALKAKRQAFRHAVRNREVKKAVRLALRAVLDAARAKDVAKLEALASKASATLDKAAQDGVLHWKAAARKKSRLALQARKLVSGAAAPAAQPAAASK